MANRSSHPLLSCADGVAVGMRDGLLLIGRVLIAAVFLMTVWTGGPSTDYLKSLNYIAPDYMSMLAHVVAMKVLAALGIPFLLLAIAAFVGNIIQHPILFSVEPILPKLSRLSPVSGLGRLFSKQALANFFKGLTKLILFGAVLAALV